MPTPYAEHLNGGDPVDALRTSLAAYETRVATLTPERWNASYAPGKWSTHQVMLHVTQWEIFFGVRVRCALSMPSYVIQPMDQDPFMDVESPSVNGPMAWDAFRAMRRMNLALAESLTGAQRRTSVQHATRGAIDVNDLLTTLAGHAIHHLKQLQQLR